MCRARLLAVLFCSLLPCVMSAAEPTAESTAGPWRMTDADAVVRSFDANRDGKLAAAEIPKNKLQAFERLLQAADKNKDAMLSGQELAAALDASAAQHGKVKTAVAPLPINPQQALKRFDTNKDGKLTTNEVPPRTQEQFKEILKTADKNQDRALDRQEIAAAVPLIQQLGQPGKVKPATQRKGKLFDLADTNGDGKLSAAEMKVVEEVLDEISE